MADHSINLYSNISEYFSTLKSDAPGYAPRPSALPLRGSVMRPRGDREQECMRRVLDIRIVRWELKLAYVVGA